MTSGLIMINECHSEREEPVAEILERNRPEDQIDLYTIINFTKYFLSIFSKRQSFIDLIIHKSRVPCQVYIKKEKNKILMKI